MKQYQYLFKEAGAFDAAGRLVGNVASAVSRAPSAAAGLGSKAVNATKGAVNAVREAPSRFAQGVREGFNPNAVAHPVGDVTATSGRVDAAALRAAMRAQRAGNASPAQMSAINSARAGQGAPVNYPMMVHPTANMPPPAAQAAPGFFAQHKQNIADLWNAGRQGGWGGFKNEFMKNPARNAAYAGGAAYGLGTGKDYMDAMTGSDEYDYNLWDKIKMGIGMEDKPGVFDPMLPFFMRGYHAGG